jgi:hypothetical protein
MLVCLAAEPDFGLQETEVVETFCVTVKLYVLPDPEFLRSPA